jgi:phospholipid/cholesterol/gamma-HCH transport system substrate-binding protein
MRRWSNEIVVGAAILLAIALGIYGYVFLREVPVREKGFVVQAHFANVTGLEVGDAVTVSGVKVGRIRKMQLEHEGVAVQLWLNGLVPLPADSRASIRSIGMIGEKYIALLPGTAVESLKEGDALAGDYVTDLADAGGSLSELMDRTTTLVSKITAAFDTAFSRREQKVVAATLGNVERLTRRTDDLMAQNTHHLNSTIAQLDSLTRGISRFWQNNHASFDSVSQNIATSTATLPMTIAKLDSAVNSTRNLLHALETQQGTLGKAIYDEELYNKANKTVDEVQALLEDVKKNPSKYLQFSVISF